MEVVIQRHTDAILRGGGCQNIEILGPIQSNLHDVDCIEAALSQESCHTRRESLIQQNRRHAT